jgi:hypothetical protein
MSTTEDPFERAAEKERRAQAREEHQKRLEKAKRTFPGIGAALRVFLLPYLVLMAVRAMRFPWGDHSLGESFLDFLFGSGWIAAATIWILFLVWLRIISRGRGMGSWMS